mgnify:CR=1 FL=1
MNLFLWVLLTFFLLYFIYDEKAPLSSQIIATLLVTALTAIPAYFTSKKLVPGLLYRRKTGRFAGALLLTVLANTVITYLITGFFYYELSGKSIFARVAVVQYLFSFFFIINCIVILVSSAVRIITDRFGMERQLRETESEKIHTELAFLRSQINPHFLFNILNTIYFQINRENEQARDLVEKLSEMLRYQLYECTGDRIDLAREIAFIRNYVELQKLRLEPGTDLQLTFPEDPGSLRIAPLLILPLVENAFKYLSHARDPGKNRLHIHLSFEGGDWFVIHVVNTCDATAKLPASTGQSGLGLQNLKRRLALLYPEKHSLTRSHNNQQYETTLKIRFGDELPGGR